MRYILKSYINGELTKLNDRMRYYRLYCVWVERYWIMTSFFAFRSFRNWWADLAYPQIWLFFQPCSRQSTILAKMLLWWRWQCTFLCYWLCSCTIHTVLPPASHCRHYRRRWVCTDASWFMSNLLWCCADQWRLPRIHSGTMFSSWTRIWDRVVRRIFRLSFRLIWGGSSLTCFRHRLFWSRFCFIGRASIWFRLCCWWGWGRWGGGGSWVSFALHIIIDGEYRWVGEV